MYVKKSIQDSKANSASPVTRRGATSLFIWKQNLFRLKVSASGKSELKYVNVGLEFIEF